MLGFRTELYFREKWKKEKLGLGKKPKKSANNKPLTTTNITFIFFVELSMSSSN